MLWWYSAGLAEGCSRENGILAEFFRRVGDGLVMGCRAEVEEIVTTVWRIRERKKSNWKKKNYDLPPSLFHVCSLRFCRVRDISREEEEKEKDNQLVEEPVLPHHAQQDAVTQANNQTCLALFFSCTLYFLSTLCWVSLFITVLCKQPMGWRREGLGARTHAEMWELQGGAETEVQYLARDIQSEGRAFIGEYLNWKFLNHSYSDFFNPLGIQSWGN